MADGKQVAGYLKEGSFPSFTVFPWKRSQRQAVFCSSLKIPYPTKELMTQHRFASAESQYTGGEKGSVFDGASQTTQLQSWLNFDQKTNTF